MMVCHGLMGNEYECKNHCPDNYGNFHREWSTYFANVSKRGTDSTLIVVVIELFVATLVNIQFMLFWILWVNVTHLFRFMYHEKKIIEQRIIVIFIVIVIAFSWRLEIPITSAPIIPLKYSIKYLFSTHTRTYSIESSRYIDKSNTLTHEILNCIKHIHRKRRHSIPINCKLLTLNLKLKSQFWEFKRMSLMK